MWLEIQTGLLRKKTVIGADPKRQSYSQAKNTRRRAFQLSLPTIYTHGEIFPRR